jgi:hypothetical protein
MKNLLQFDKNKNWPKRTVREQARCEADVNQTEFHSFHRIAGFARSSVANSGGIVLVCSTPRIKTGGIGLSSNTRINGMLQLQIAHHLFLGRIRRASEEAVQTLYDARIRTEK